MMRRVLAVGIVLSLAVSTGLPGVVVAQPTPAASGGTGPDISVAASHAASGTVTYRISVGELDRTDRFSLIVGANAVVTDVRGFERREAGSRTRFVSTDDQGTGTVVVETSPASAGAGNSEYVAGDDWALARVPYVVARWSAPGSAESHHVRPLGDEFDGLADSATGTYGDRYGLVGAQTVETSDVNGQAVRIARPAGTAVPAGTETVIASLRSASEGFRVGDRDEELTLFALPEPARRGGESFPSRDEAWVNANSPVNSPNNVWVHEYVHTRQAFELGEDMAWFREASAEYYAAELTHEQGRITEREMVAHLGGAAVTAPLTDPGAWDDERVPYTKGARVLALLDRHIEQSTDGARSLQDVFRRMNAHDGRVTYADFKRMVEATAGHSMDGWLDRYVAGDHAIASAYEPEPARSGLLGVVAAIAAGESAVLGTVIVSVVASAAISLPLLTIANRLRRRFARARPRPDLGR